MPGIMSAEIRSSSDMQWIRPVRAGCWMVAAVWNIAEDFSGIKRDLRIELRIRMQLVGLSAHASVGLRLTHIIELLGLRLEKKNFRRGLVCISCK